MICSFRESQARELDLPRQHVLSNKACVALALRNPQKPEQLIKLKDVSTSERRRYGEQLIELLKNLSSMVSEGRQALPDKIAPPRRLPKPVLKNLTDTLNKMSESMGLDVQLLMRRRWKNQLLESIDKDDPFSHLPPELLGFRRQLVSEPLIELLKQA